MPVLCYLVNYVFLVLLIAALSLIQCLIGGTRLLFAFPSYGILGVCGVLTIASAFRIRKERPDSWCLLSCLLLIGYVVGRAQHSPIEYLARPDFFMALGCLLVYLITAFYLTTTRDRLIVLCALYVLAALHVYVGTIQFTRTSEYMLFGFLRNDTSFRASGLYISGNHTSGFLGAVGVIGLSLVWWSRWPLWAKILLSYMCLACYFGVGITVSRGGMLSSMISILALSALGLTVIRRVNRERFVKAVAIWGTVLALAGGAGGFAALHSQLIQARVHQDSTKDARWYNWQATLDQFHVAPLFGTGSGTHLFYGRLFRRPQIQADPVHSHGDYLELLAEYGIAGATGLGLLLVAHLRSGFRAFNFLARRLRNSYPQKSNTLALNIGVLCAVFGLMAHSVVDFNMHIPANALVFAFFFGILANPGIATERPETALEKGVAWLRFGLPILGVGVCALAIPKYPGEYFFEKSRVALRDKNWMEAITMAKRGLGETYSEDFWLDRWNKRFGGEKKNPFAYFYIGEANRSIGTQMTNRFLRKTYFRPAVDAYLKSLHLFPNDENTLIRLGQCYDGLEQFNEAEKQFAKAIQCDPNLEILYEYYAAHLKLQGKEAEVAGIVAKAKALAKQQIIELGNSELK